MATFVVDKRKNDVWTPKAIWQNIPSCRVALSRLATMCRTTHVEQMDMRIRRVSTKEEIDNIRMTLSSRGNKSNE